MRKIVIDTTEFEAQKRIDSVQFKELQSHIELGSAELAIPEIVLHEFSNKYSDRIRESLVTLNKAIENAEYHLGISVREKFSEEMIDAEIERLVADLKTKLVKDFKTSFLPFPSTPHSDLARKAVRGEKPFNKEKNKNSYRDALLWESIKEYLSGHPEDEVVLISNNTADFCDIRKPDTETTELAEILVKELELLGINKSRIAFFKFLKDYISKEGRNSSRLIEQLDSESEPSEEITIDFFEYEKNFTPEFLTNVLQPGNNLLDPILPNHKFEKIVSIDSLELLESQLIVGAQLVRFLLQIDLIAEFRDRQTTLLEPEGPLQVMELTVVVHAFFNTETKLLSSLQLVSTII